MAFNSSNYFDIYTIFVNEIVGNLPLFIILGIIGIALYSLRHRIPPQVTYLLVVVWGGIIFAKTFYIVVWIFLVFIVGFAFYWGIAKIFKR